MSDKKPEIIFSKGKPLIVIDIDDLSYFNGDPVPTEPVMTLCRCGQSCRMPFCDGSHSKEGFNDEPHPNKIPSRTRSYEGSDITIHFNLSVCSHVGICLKELPDVFDTTRSPWIEPNAAGVRAIVKTIENCPSGALSYTIGDRTCDCLEREPKIIISRKGPLNVEGNVPIRGDMPVEPYNTEHYSLCRCGKTKNSPFCDGSHRE